MTIRKYFSGLAMLAVFIFGYTCAAVAQQGNTPGATPTLTAPDIDALEAEDSKAKERTGPCCHTKGVPECGGACDICCQENEQASCVAGGCDPNNTFACTCAVTTSCSCN